MADTDGDSEIQLNIVNDVNEERQGDVGWLVVLRLNVPVNNFSVIWGRSHRFLGN